MKFAYQFFFFLFLTGGLQSYAQTPVYPNPTPCGDLGAIRDFTCPDDGSFYQPNRFIIRVEDAPGTRLGTDIYLKEVRLIISHPWLADLTLRLASPSGKTILLASNKGGDQDNFGDPDSSCGTVTRFSVGSCIPIPQDGAPYTDQPYLPEQSLLGLNDGVTSPLGDWVLQICDDTEQDSGRLEFVELVFEPISCLPVSDVRVLSQDTTTVVLTWDNPGACSDSLTVVEYGPKGFIPGTSAQGGSMGTIVMATCPPFVLSGLLPDTDYEVYVRRLCAGFPSSENSCVQAFRTGCLPPGPHTVEQFLAETPCEPVCNVACPLMGIWRNEVTNALPWIVYSGATPTDGTGPSDAVDSGGKYVYLETSGASCTGTATLSSGCFEVTQPLSSACHFSFYYHMAGAHIGSLGLEVSSDGMTWNRLWEKNGNQGNTWHKEYLGLPTYPIGTMLRFRFSATRGNGSLGDIGLDEIGVHGLSYAGWPAYTYYADRDSDGYGNSDEKIQNCSPVQIPGFVLEAGDCNDQNPLIHPGAAEIACDGLDNNCNGMADDFILPAPEVQSDSVCSGEQPVLAASTVPGGYIFWYDQAGGAPIAFSSGLFNPVLPLNAGKTAQTYTYYAQAVDPGFQCFSDAVSEVVAVVNPVPEGIINQQPVFCAGDSVNLKLLDIRDVRQTGATIRYFSGASVMPEEELTQQVIAPDSSIALTYRLTSPQGCIFEDQFLLEEKPLPVFDLFPADSFSLCTGSVRRVEVVGAVGSYQFSWGDGTQLATTHVTGGLLAGISTLFPVQVTNEFGCTLRDTILYYTTSSIDSIYREVLDVGTCNTADGRISVRPLDGVPPFSYSWEGSWGVQGQAESVEQVPFVLDNLAQGSYRITITDSSNEKCAFTMPSAYVNGPGAVIAGVDILDNTCAGDRSGRICVRTVSPNPIFQWSNGQQSACIDQLGAGSFDLTITEGGCATELKGIRVEEPAPLKVIPDIRIPTCSNSSDGSVHVQVFGGAGGYRYQWSNGRLSKDIQGLSAGIYTLTLTDAVGCMLVSSFEVPTPAPVELLLDTLRNVRCSGEKDGALFLSATGGVPPYRFNWADDGSVSPVRTGLEKGRYVVSVQDVLGCTSVAEFAIVEPQPLQAAIITQQLPVCKGDSTGSLLLIAQGGTAPYSVHWSTGKTEVVADSLPVGTYWVLTEDLNGCQTDTLVQVLKERTYLNWNAQITPVFCPGRTDGGISLAPTGKEPFVFKWEKGDTTAVVQQLAQGVYPVTITDAAGCSYDTSLSVEPVRQRFQLVTQGIAPTCSGGTDGVIYVQPRQVEFPPLRYRWENGSTFRDRQGLSEGSYGLTVTDAMGCISQLDSLLLQSPPPLAYQVLSQGTLRCKGDSTAFIELEVTGGQAPYTFQWQGTNSSTSAAYQLKAGLYQVYVQDARGCLVQADFTVSEPDLLSAEVVVTSGNSCLGDTTVRVQAIVTGGVGPYQLEWSNGATWATLENPLPGDYVLTVRDASGCQRETPSLKVREPVKPLQLERFEGIPITCFGKHDGRLEAQITGGKGPYTYLFKGTSTLIKSASTAVSIGNLGRGSNYAVVVTDALGCRVESATRAVNEPPEIQLVLDSAHTSQCASRGVGDLYVSVSGGSPPYAFNWIDSSGRAFATTEDQIGIPGGRYAVIATDIFLCSDTLSGLTVIEKKPLVLKRVLVNGITCKGEATGSLLIELDGGKPPYQIWWNGVAGGPVLGNLPAGTYQPEVVDADQCRTLFPAIPVREPDSVLVIQEVVLPVSCGERTDGAVWVTISGGKKPYKLTWQNKFGETIGLDSFQLLNLSPGSYGLLVRDSFHCLRSYSYKIGIADPIAIDWETHPPGVNGLDGSVRAHVTGGSPPYFFSWSTGEVGPLLDSIPTGTYSLTVTDARNCTSRDFVYLAPTSIAGILPVGADVRVAPNPSEGTFSLYLRWPDFSHSLSWVLRNAWGQTIQKGQLPYGQEWIQPLYLPTDGIYFISLEEEGRIRWTGKVIIQ